MLKYYNKLEDEEITLTSEMEDELSNGMDPTETLPE